MGRAVSAPWVAGRRAGGGLTLLRLKTTPAGGAVTLARATPAPPLPPPPEWRPAALRPDSQTDRVLAPFGTWRHSPAAPRTRAGRSAAPRPAVGGASNPRRSASVPTSQKAKERRGPRTATGRDTVSPEAEPAGRSQLQVSELLWAARGFS